MASREGGVDSVEPTAAMKCPSLDARQQKALERELRVSMLSLQWKELQYLHSAFQNLATSSAVLVGFGFSALGISSAYHPEQSTAHSSVWELLNDRTSGILVSEIVFQAIFSIAASSAACRASHAA